MVGDRWIWTSEVYGFTNLQIANSFTLSFTVGASALDNGRDKTNACSGAEPEEPAW
jgi:hypothetical protein